MIQPDSRFLSSILHISSHKDESNVFNVYLFVTVDVMYQVPARGRMRAPECLPGGAKLSREAWLQVPRCLKGLHAYSC